MNLTGLLGSILPSSGPNMYGIPVAYSSSEDNAGRFTPPTNLQELLGTIPVLKNFVNTRGTITVNPKNSNNPARTLAHESIHGLLSPSNESGQLAKWNADNPFFPAMSQALLKSGAASPDTVHTEAAAYATTGEAKALGIDPAVSDGYIQHLNGQIMNSDSKTAKQIQAATKAYKDSQ